MSEPGTPLSDIRAAELAAARSVTAETEKAERTVTEARRRAVEMVDEARLAGRAAADQRFEDAVTGAEQQAAEISALLDGRMARLRESVGPELDRLAEAMLGVIVPPEGTE